MKKVLGIAVGLLIVFGFFVGCGGKKETVRDLKLSVTTSNQQLVLRSGGV